MTVKLTRLLKCNEHKKSFFKLSDNFHNLYFQQIIMFHLGVMIKWNSSFQFPKYTLITKINEFVLISLEMLEWRNSVLSQNSHVKTFILLTEFLPRKLLANTYFFEVSWSHYILTKRVNLNMSKSYKNFWFLIILINLS